MAVQNVRNMNVLAEKARLYTKKSVGLEIFGRKSIVKLAKKNITCEQRVDVYGN